MNGIVLSKGQEINVKLFCSRIYMGWTIEEALNKQLREANKIELLFTYKGETKRLMEWSRLYNIKYSTLSSRIYNRGWDIEKALTTNFVVKIDKKNKILTYLDETKNIIRVVNINYRTLFSRIYSMGWSIEKALNTPLRNNIR